MFIYYKLLIILPQIAVLANIYSIPPLLITLLNEYMFKSEICKYVNEYMLENIDKIIPKHLTLGLKIKACKLKSLRIFAVRASSQRNMLPRIETNC